MLLEDKNCAVGKSVETVIGLGKIKNHSRKIEQIELDYFLKESGKRLLKVKSGIQLHRVIETQRKQNFP